MPYEIITNHFTKSVIEPLVQPSVLPEFSRPSHRRRALSALSGETERYQENLRSTTSTPLRILSLIIQYMTDGLTEAYQKVDNQWSSAEDKAMDAHLRDPRRAVSFYRWYFRLVRFTMEKKSCRCVFLSYYQLVSDAIVFAMNCGQAKPLGRGSWSFIRNTTTFIVDAWVDLVGPSHCRCLYYMQIYEFAISRFEDWRYEIPASHLGSPRFEASRNISSANAVCRFQI